MSIHGIVVQNEDSDMARKQREADQLRAAEKFMVVGTGEAECTSCGFIYDPRKGDPEYPVGPGTQFKVILQSLPCSSDAICKGLSHAPLQCSAQRLEQPFIDTIAEAMHSF